jgi:hypothetical protein
MPRLLLAVLVALGVVVAGWSVAQEPAKPAEKEDPPLRLKKRNDPPPKADPKAEPGERLRDPKKGDPDKKPGEEGPPAPLPKESEAEVVARIIANMHRSEEKLEKRELDEGILQTQADVLKDLDSLIALGEKQQQQQQQNNAGGGGSPQSQDRQESRGGSKPQKGSQQAGGNKPRGGNRPSSGSKPRGGMRAGGSRPGQSKSRGRSRSGTALAQAKPQSNPGGGANPGAGGKSETGRKDLAADQYKDTWGHLPQSLRAEMNAYSNPRPFMPRYDDLIKRYYRTIAEKGRK